MLFKEDRDFLIAAALAAQLPHDHQYCLETGDILNKNCEGASV
jgi:hypothetical protein